MEYRFSNQRVFDAQQLWGYTVASDNPRRTATRTLAPASANAVAIGIFAQPQNLTYLDDACAPYLQTRKIPTHAPAPRE